MKAEHHGETQSQTPHCYHALCISWSRTFLQTTNKRLWNKSDAAKKPDFHITSYLWGSPQLLYLWGFSTFYKCPTRGGQSKALPLPPASLRWRLQSRAVGRSSAEEKFREEKVSISLFPGRKSQPRPTGCHVCWICNSDQGQSGYFTDKTSPLSWLFSRTSELEMCDKEACMGKEKLGLCMVIFFLMIFSNNLVHTYRYELNSGFTTNEKSLLARAYLNTTLF